MQLIQKIKTKAKEKAILQAINILPNLSDENLIRFFSILGNLTTDKGLKKSVKEIENGFRQGTPFSKLFKKILKNSSKKSKEKLVKNLIVNYLLLGPDMRRKAKKELGFIPPAFLVISPSMRCNLRCIGCYAGEYTKKDDLPFEVVDRILKEAKELGMYFCVVSGGEPFFREDLLKLWEKHNDMYFLVYTNGTLITKEMAKKLAELGNVTPAISVEGFEKETDHRRGKGVYTKVNQAMDNLREAGVIFGFSVTPTKYNSDVIASEEFIDYYIKKGCTFGWFFQYIPIGLKPDVSLMSTPEQRNHLREQILKFRQNKDIFMGDFWNDGPHVNGCLAGGRMYFHINCKGDVEPCVFVHFAVDNIKNKSIKQVLSSGFFAGIKKAYMHRENLLTPCIIIDQPQVLRGLVNKFHAYPTHPGAESIIQDPKIKKHLDKYSKEMEKLTRPIWEKEYKPDWSKRYKKLQQF